jgi:hypothetical protein
MLLGESPVKRKVEPRPRPPSPDGPSFSHERVMEIANDQIAKKPKITIDLNNARLVGDVIAELTDMKLEAMRRPDYVLAQRIETAIENLRLHFRTHDREGLHTERVSALDSRLKDAKTSTTQATDYWKTKMANFTRDCARELSALQERHNDEMIDLAALWDSAQTKRRFAKKSPSLLNALTIEKNLALVGDFQVAEQVRRINQRSEKVETNQRWAAMEGNFESAREQLLFEQNRERRELIANHDARRAVLMKKQADDISVLTNRQQGLRNALLGDGDYNKFIAKKFKKPSDMVVSMSATISGGSDIPVPGLGVVSRDVENLMRYRVATVATPLNLPPLKVTPLRRSAKAGRGSSRRTDL